MVRKSKKSLFKSEIYQTENEYVKCTKLPEFIRAKKYLGGPFCVYFENKVVPDGVKVTIRASNFKNPNAELKNNESLVKNGMAEFTDLRFNGKSGRGMRRKRTARKKFEFFFSLIFKSNFLKLKRN